MARIVVSGYMLRFPVPGNVLAYFHYVLGLHRLGHKVVYLEESGWPYGCYDPSSREWHDYPAAGLRTVRRLARETGIEVPFVFVNRETFDCDGATWPEIKSLLAQADLLINLGGVCWLEEFKLCGLRVFVDMDPMFTQIGRFGAKVLGDYHLHFAYGTSIGTPECAVPTLGIDWLPLNPPVVADWWSIPLNVREDAPFTTVANWTAYGAVEWNGERYGQKDEEFLRILDLPRRTTWPLELTLSGGEDVAPMLREAGWRVRDSGEGVGIKIDSYRNYIAGSRGEFSVAKNAYVKTRCGWISDRTVCYLASGLPAVIQDTGRSDRFPERRGVLTFSNIDEAAAAIDSVNRDYAGHRQAARQLALQHFHSDVVLSGLLDLAWNRRKIYASVEVAG
jgi:hypothetical protein